MKRKGAQTVLIIHHLPEILSAMDHPLRQVGYRVLTALDSQTGLEIAQREHPDLIISDELMLGIDGSEDGRRRETHSRATSLLLIKSQPAAARARAGQTNSTIEADDYLETPLDPLLLPLILIAKVTRLLEQKRGEEALRKETEAVGLLRDVASAANQAASIHEAVLICLDQLCALTQCQVGHLYLTAANSQHELIPTSFWHMEDPERFKKFIEVTESTRISQGEGFVGRTFATGQPAWSLDLSQEPDFRRAAQAAEAGIKSAFAFPILIEEEVVGVLEFFSLETMVPDASLLSVMTVVGAQLGQVVERERSEKALQESASKYRMLMEQASDGILIIAQPGRYLSLVNSKACEMLGYRLEEFLELELEDLFLPEDLAVTPLGFRELNNGRTLLTERRLRRKDGSVFTAELSTRKLEDRIQVIFRDVTARKRAEEALRESEERFRIAMDAARMGTWDLDILTGIATRSGNFERMLGLTSGGNNGSMEEFLACVHPEDREFVTRKIAESVEKKATGHECEYRAVWPDGSIHWLAGKGQVMYDDTGRPVRMIGVAMDLTEQKVLESQLRQAQKLESIGQLAAGIAHEINTPTQYVGDNTHFLQDAFGDLTQLLEKHQELLNACHAGHATQALVAEIESLSAQLDLAYLSTEIPKAIQQSLEGISRVTKIVQSMKDFAHPSSAEKQAADLNQAIESTITVARNEWKYIAEMVTDLDPDLPLVPCMLGEFNQVILNMIINATHAIADVVGNGVQGKGQITISTRREGDYALISVTDTGTGIPEKIRDKVFDPFFTTKQVGKGTGQGLAISHTVIVEKHGGSLSFKTEEGGGTTFFIRLPIAGERVMQDRRKQAEAKVSTGV